MIKYFITLIFGGFIGITSNAQSLLWSKSAGGFGTSDPLSQCTDVSGNTYITGLIEGFGQIVIFGTDTFNCPLNSDVFIAKYDINGNVLWAKTAGGTNTIDGSLSVALDTTGNIFITGFFRCPSIIFGTYTLTNTGGGSGGSNIFIVKYNSNGNVIWAKNIGGIAGVYSDTGCSISTDKSGNVFISGSFNSPMLTFGTYTLTHSFGTSSTSVFIAKYDNNGNVLWAKQGTGSSSKYNYCYSVCTDVNGNSFISGSFLSPMISFGTYTLSNPSLSNVFLVKYDINGNVQWAKSSTASGGGGGQTYSGSTDVNGNIYITGDYINPSFAFSTYSLTSNGQEDIFLTKYDTNGNVLWAKSFGGINRDVGWAICTFTNGLYVTGGFGSPITFGTTTLTPTASDPMFVTRFDLNGNVDCAINVGGGGEDNCGVGIDKYGNLYVSSDDYNVSYETAFVKKYSSCPSLAGIESIYKEGITVRIYPNPNNGSFKIQIDNEINNGELILINSLGQKVYEQTVRQGINNINTSDLAKGLYNYILLQDKQKIKDGKLVVD